MFDEGSASPSGGRGDSPTRLQSQLSPEPSKADSDPRAADIDLTGPETTAANRASAENPPPAPASDRAAQLESDHWRERAVIWRERAMAAELMVTILERNLDELRNNVADLRREAEAASAARAIAAAPSESASSPWRRFMRDLYETYLR